MALLGTAIGQIGNLLGLKEYGISEALGGIQPMNFKPQAFDYSQPQPVLQPGSAPEGQIRGTTTQPTATKSTTQLPAQLPPQTPPPQGADPNAYLQQQANDLYAQLDAQLGTATQQRDSQNQFINQTYDSNAADLKRQLDFNVGEMDTTQNKNLRDLAGNLRQSWQQGNAMLGTRGASDSSAAGQYAYALTKLGSQQRGNLLDSYTQARNGLRNTYESNLTQLQTQKNTAINQLNNWYADIQNQIKQQQGSVKVQLSQQAFQYAQQTLQQIQNSYQTSQANLQSWALSRSQTIDQYNQIMSGLTKNLPTAQPLNTQAYSNGSSLFGAQTGYGQTSEKKWNPTTGRYE